MISTSKVSLLFTPLFESEFVRAFVGNLRAFVVPSLERERESAAIGHYAMMAMSTTRNKKKLHWRRVLNLTLPSPSMPGPRDPRKPNPEFPNPTPLHYVQEGIPQVRFWGPWFLPCPPPPPRVLSSYQPCPRQPRRTQARTGASRACPT